MRRLLHRLIGLAFTLWALTALQPWMVVVRAAVTCTQVLSGNDGTNSQTYTTASWTPTANTLQLIVVANSHATDANTVTSVAQSGGLSFTCPNTDQVWTSVFDSTDKRLTICHGMTSSPVAATATITITGTSNTEALWKGIECSGVDTGGSNGSGAIVQSKVAGTTSTLTPTLSYSAGFGDTTNNVAYSASAIANNTTWAAGSGFTELGAESSAASPAYTLGHQQDANGFSGTSVDGGTFGGSAAATGMAIVEIKMATAGGTARPSHGLLGLVGLHFPGVRPR